MFKTLICVLNKFIRLPDIKKTTTRRKHKDLRNLSKTCLKLNDGITKLLFIGQITN